MLVVGVSWKLTFQFLSHSKKKLDNFYQFFLFLLFAGSFSHDSKLVIEAGKVIKMYLLKLWNLNIVKYKA